ncbi:DUF6381 family protein [Streptomyces sp. NPDC058231]|uniref:DUF6381 family protein n=1 Tax=unclassified Streptomyces TaxID=2593676 RepID=UPI0036E6CE48
MSEADEVRGRARQMRAEAKGLKVAAERTADPEERQRLTEKARKLENDSEQASGMASGDIYPMM